MDIRPTSDRLRETLFNVVAPRTPDSVWLDLFAGSGAVGIEALSRGARMVYFVESSKKAVRTIRDNLESLEIHDGYELLQNEVAPVLRSLGERRIQCDVAFIDPPYAQHAGYVQAFSALASSPLLAAESWVIAEHDKRFDPGENFGQLRRFRELKQGDAVLSFYRLIASER
jgi:16S rRNA (guanine966-N2)-methyltransferase